MERITESYCKLYANFDAYKKKLIRTKQLVTDMLSICKSPYVAFSCGKDSSVLADLILQQNSNVPLRFLSSGETRILHNVDTVINYFKENYHATIEEINVDRVFSDEWKSATFDEQRKAGRRDIQSMDNSLYSGVFMGLRIEESRGRAISLRMHKTKDFPKYMYKYVDKEYYRMCPLADWKTEDIGAYIVTHDIPILKWYRDFGFDSRTTARLTGDSVRQNTILWVKYTNPAGYAKLIDRFPELKIYS